MAVVEAVNTAAPVLWFVHVDHLNRPVKMTNAAKAAVWDAVFLPWGGVHAIAGSATLDARFPGQWFQLETGLHYNWHRSYDPSIGRYTQPDPLGFVDGPSVFGYARGGPQALVDRDGRNTAAGIAAGTPFGPGGMIAGGIAGTGVMLCIAYPELCKKVLDFCLRRDGDPAPPPPTDEECRLEWMEARRVCLDLINEEWEQQQGKRPKRSVRNVTGGFHNDLNKCAKGLVSEQCGGNRIAK
jgi:RHS repeat-associated protein